VNPPPPAPETSRRIRIGIDVGGTFTDIVGMPEDGSPWTVRKVPSTPENPSIAVLRAIDLLLEEEGSCEVTFLGHGTTAGTNAFLTKRGAPTLLLTTRGFEDVLEFRRMDRTGVLDPYDLQLQFPTPLVPKYRRIGVLERIGRDGEVVTALSPEEIDRVVDVIRHSDAEAVAISLLWSFANPDHEITLKKAIEAEFPELFVSCSNDIDPTMMEYERTSTTVINAYLGPLISRYFDQVETRVGEMGLPEPRIMQSNGGLASIKAASRRPVALLESGPAAGVAACVALAGETGDRNVLAVDMGGTSFDVALVVDGSPTQHIETEVDGYIVRVPMLDIRSIGAGGGSIAWIDEHGGLRVGPQSAGSQPGPVCYGRGGTSATVSDANAVLGYLQDLTGGSLKLDVVEASRALATQIGEPLGLSALEAASGVYRLVNANMADAMRVMMSESAVNPLELTLMAYGGAGPVHASALARELDIARTVIPAHPGALSALGVATGDLVHDLAEAVMQPLDILRAEDLRQRFAHMEGEGRAILAEEGVTGEAVTMQGYVVARYIGQMHDLQVVLDQKTRLHPDPARIAQQFHELHRDVYGVSVEDEPVLVVSARTRAIGRTPKPPFGGHAGDAVAAPAHFAPAWFEGTGMVDTPVYLRQPWQPAVLHEGPAIILEYDSTTMVLPGQTWELDSAGSIVIKEGQ
jgi:N-methylhydantoinase A